MLQAPLAPPVGHAQAQEAMDGRNTETASAGGTVRAQGCGLKRTVSRGRLLLLQSMLAGLKQALIRLSMTTGLSG